MKHYVGTKFIQAEPMTRGAYNIHRGWEIPADENPEDPGYLVQYSDGYISWSPAVQFEMAYQWITAMSFSSALVALKHGNKVARAGWNGKNMFIFLVAGSTFQVSRPPLNRFYPEGTEVDYHAHVDMKTADGQIVPWLCSQTDMLADDWCIVK